MKLSNQAGSSQSVRLRLSLVLGAMAIGSATSTATWAEDGKLYPGNNCVTSADYHAIDAVGEDANAISNTSRRNSLYVRCPIIRDYMSASTGMKKVRVFFKNANPQSRISCSVQVRNGDGSLKLLRSGSSTLGDYEGEFTINVNQAGGYKTSYSMGCRIPPTLTQSNLPGIKAYRVDEYN